MRRVHQLGLLTVLASGSFMLAYAMRREQAAPVVGATTTAIPAANAPDSVRLAAFGIRPGRQLIAYVLVSSHCGYCQRDDTKAALASVRTSLRRAHARDFQAIRVIGVAVNTEVDAGLEYLRSVGMASFDEISAGDGWLNEQIGQLIWRAKTTDASVPQVVVVSRPMTARLGPMAVTYGSDSTLAVVAGPKAITSWVRGGTGLTGVPTTPEMPVRQRTTTAAEASSITVQR